ncbi:hypothetical protein RSAG8_13089, partial [Rhizoctonia solani AG-8 WAC10335]
MDGRAALYEILKSNGDKLGPVR